MKYILGICAEEPLWSLLDIYGNCISIELAEDPQNRPVSLNDQFRSINTRIGTLFFKEIYNELIPYTFLPVHSSSISFCPPSSNAFPKRSIVIYDTAKNSDGLVFFSGPLQVDSGLLIQIISIATTNESRVRRTTTALYSNILSSHIQFGITNCNTQILLQTNDLPLDIEQINSRSEFWIVQDFKLGNKSTIDRGDEFFFALNQDGIVQYSHNNSKLQDFIHVDPNLDYYPFLLFKGDIIVIRSMGYLKNVDKYRSLYEINKTESSQQLTASNSNEIRKNDESKLHQDCTICYDQLRDTVLIPCGHICLCYTCAKGLFENGTKQCEYLVDMIIND